MTYDEQIKRTSAYMLLPCTDFCNIFTLKHTDSNPQIYTNDIEKNSIYLYYFIIYNSFLKHLRLKMMKRKNETDKTVLPLWGIGKH